MRSFMYVVTLLIIVLQLSVAEAATYAFRTTAYNWETTDINVVWDQTQTAYPRDDDKQVVNLGFTFNFAGVNYTQVRIHANGVLQFGADTQFHRQFTNTNLPVTVAPPSCSGCIAGSQADRLLAIYWDDINPRLGGTVRYQTKGSGTNRRFVVSWENVPHYNFGGQYTFQIVLYENGEFVYQYGAGNASGVSATIGVEVDNTDYTLYSFDSSFSYAGTAIRWFKPSGEPQRLAEYWFEEGQWSYQPNEVIDWSGNGYNGNAMGNTQSTADGWVCRAANIPLNTTVVSSGINTNIDVDAAIGSSGSISFWYNSNVRWNNSDNQLFDATSQNNRWFYLTKRSNGRLRFAVTDSNGTTIAAETSPNNTNSGIWRHIAVTWRLAPGNNQTILRVYVDGNLQSSQQGTTNGSLPASLGTLVLGDNASNFVQSGLGTLNSSDGRIDEVRVYNFEISNADVLNDMAASHDCVFINHLRIEHDGQGLTCAAENITLKACSNNDCSVLYPGFVTATINANGTNIGSTSFSGGSTTFAVSQPVPASLMLGGTISPAALFPTQCRVDTGNVSCNLAFVDTGWLFDPIESQISGVNFNTGVRLQAVRKDNNTGACQSVLTGTQTVELRLRCVDPASCSADAQMQFQFRDAANQSRQLSKNTFASYSLNFSGGAAELALANYNDVGSLRIDAQKTMATGALLSGSSNTFVVRPHTLAVVQAKRQDGSANPGTTNTGVGFVAAGEPFNIVIEARNAQGMPTPSFGREAVRQLVQPVYGALEYPAAGRDGLFNPGVTDISQPALNGQQTVTDVSWHEAGSIRLQAKLNNDTYLGVADVSSKPLSDVIGRFYPQHFELTASDVQNGCRASADTSQHFSYMSEDKLSLSYQVSAQGLAGNTLENYHTGAYADTAQFLLVAQNNTQRLDAGRLEVNTGQWLQGVYSVTQTNAAFNRTATPDGPYTNLQFGLQVLTGSERDNRNFPLFTLGADAVALNGEVNMRFGRLLLQNGAGPEEEPLPLVLRSEYWDGSRFIVNQQDSCSVLTAGQLSSLTSPALSFAGAGAPLQQGVLPAGALWAQPSLVPGVWRIEYQASPWLQYNWSGTAAGFDENPQAELMFGRFRGNPRQISWRELFQ
ncbi:LamG domain-containing protein [Rheinheimera nanhaiensis]|uniref:DUF6701 domain-containing protein n=1 Tax=Rheinheimera nanhaiensis E407-8 TaxID=562729 RepID=I1DW86_9GAMM|nr:LamG domain-containing protein [Rheinheimera nanhaiensis]GAB58314.1 hypothetical protein RNAN_1286 [Rheinheimera nanhaiensis E407-8]